MLVLAAVVTQACAVTGLSFVQDDRLDITMPGDNETVDLPLEVSWSADEIGERYLVLFDRSPMRPSQSLLSLVPESDPCRAEETCPDTEWLEQNEIYVTHDTRLVVERLRDRRDSNGERDRHTLTIVLLDDAGKRVGESAFVREFILERED